MVHLERPQVPLVHSDQTRLGAESSLELHLVVHLDESREPELCGPSCELSQLAVVERRHDQEDGVGAHAASIHHVGLLHREVLAQHGQIDRGACRRQIGGGASEVVRVGEHREARGAAGGVLLRHHVGLESGVELALRRGPALDLGDARQPVGPRSAREVPWGRRLYCSFDQVSERTSIVGSPGPVRREDVRQVRGHDLSG